MDTIDTEQCAELLHCKPDHVEELARTGREGVSGLTIRTAGSRRHALWR